MTASPTQINVVCNELIAEAEAIVKYTSDIELIKEGDPKLVKTFMETRLDELEHIQNLTVALTELLVEEEEEGGGGSE
jgi:hypothetical protein